MKSLISVLCVVLVMVSALAAQPLADRVPADAIAYIGWRGTENLPTEYQNSHLKAIVDNSKIREFVTEFIPQGIARMSGQQRQPVAETLLVRRLLTTLWSKPTAIYFTGMDMSNPNDPMPKIALICQAGADSAGLAQQIQAMTAGQNNVPLRVADVSGVLVMAIGYAQPADALAQSTASLSRSPAFVAALKQVQADPMMICYADVEKGLALAQSFIPANAPPQMMMIPRVIDALGLKGLKRYISTSGFDGRDWMSQTFVEAPAPRAGLMQLLDGQAIAPDLLKQIPGDSTFASSLRFDPAAVIARVRDAVGLIDPQAQGMFDQGLGAVQIALARDLRTEILEPLGQDWAIYCSPNVAGNGVMGIVVVNKLDDPARARASLPTAAVNLSNWASVMLRRFNAPVEIGGKSTEIGGQRIYYIAAPVIAPSFAVKGDYLYLGLFPQPVAAGTRWNNAAGAKSIAENEKFIALQRRMGVANPVSFSFYDLQTTATQTGIYQQLMVICRYMGIGDMFGVPFPEPLLPPLDVLREHMTPAGSFAWIDDAGYHVKTISPFPGSKLFSEPGIFSGGGAAMSATMVSILLPSLNRARETANRVKCAAQLKSMGQGLMLYAGENRGRYPATLGELVKTQEMIPQVFVCPSGDNEIPQAILLQGVDAQAAWVDANADYVYLGRGRNAGMRADEILIYEKPDSHDAQGMNMLFGDGHVEFLLMREALQMIDRQAPAGAR